MRAEERRWDREIERTRELIRDENGEEAKSSTEGGQKSDEEKESERYSGGRQEDSMCKEQRDKDSEQERWAEYEEDREMEST